ncbi:hypothetical protein [Leifsonia sp. WHRI 6310E]|uniref:hypothetical protein n=1 Tax=Leifsonia sp. WHRI 6310E TaxID=3162562 RepID=UPI0032ED3EFD
MNTNRLWVIGAALAGIVVLLLGWVLGAQPFVNAAIAADSERTAVTAQNRAATDALAKLKADFAQLTALDSKLGTARASIPEGGDTSAFVRQVQAAAQAAGVDVRAVTVADAVRYSAPSNQGVAAAPSSAAASSSSSTPSPSPTPGSSATQAPAAPAPDAPVAAPPSLVKSDITPANFAAIPIQLDVSGTREGVMAFVKSVQSGARLFLLTALSVTSDASGAATAPGAAAPAAATYTGHLGGQVYVLLAPASSTPSATPGPTGSSGSSDPQTATPEPAAGG